MFQHLAFNEAEFLSKFGGDRHPPQGDALTCATLHDTADNRGSLVNPMVHQGDRDWDRAGFDQLADRSYQLRWLLRAQAAEGTRSAMSGVQRNTVCSFQKSPDPGMPTVALVPFIPTV